MAIVALSFELLLAPLKEATDEMLIGALKLDSRQKLGQK